MNKMKIEIWSDVACPFCYIGKRHFEKALEQFPNRDSIEIKWKSFQLDPNAKREQNKNISEVLSEKYGVTIEQAKEMNEDITEMAKKSGLEFNLDEIKLTNTFDAHRLIHLADKNALQDKAEERLFSAYLEKGKHIGSHDTLINLGAEIGLDEDEIKQMLNSNQFETEVREDIYESKQLGIQGVPFFLFDGKYAVSGAQPTDLFLEVLNDIWKKDHSLINIETSGGICSTDGVCSV